MRLVYVDQQNRVTRQVKIGDRVITSNGDVVTVKWFKEPHKVSSSGKVTVETEQGATREYFVGVISAKWIEREDRGQLALPFSHDILDWNGSTGVVLVVRYPLGKVTDYVTYRIDSDNQHCSHGDYGYRDYDSAVQAFNERVKALK